MRILTTAIFLLFCFGFLGCMNSPDRNAGENAQLLERIEEKDQKIATLEESRNQLQEENTRLKTKLAEFTSGTYEKEEYQRTLDARKEALDARERNLIERESTVESQLSQRRTEVSSQLKEREDAVSKREVSIAAREKEFHDRTNMTMEEIGAARQVQKQFENMREERNAAAATAAHWLTFVWYVSVGLGIAVIACVTLLVITISKHVSGQRELQNRREVAQLLSTAIEAQLPPEQGRLVVDAMNRLTRIEQSENRQDTA